MTTLLVFKREQDNRLLSLVQEQNALMIIFRESEVKTIKIINSDINEETMIKTLKFLGSTLKFNKFDLDLMDGITIHQRIDGRFEIGGIACVRSIVFNSFEILP